MELSAHGLSAPVGELSQLAAGQLLSLHRKVAEPASLQVAGIEMFRAAAARSGDTRAAQILAPEVSSKGATSGMEKMEKKDGNE